MCSNINKKSPDYLCSYVEKARLSIQVMHASWSSNPPLTHINPELKEWNSKVGPNHLNPNHLEQAPEAYRAYLNLSSN